MRKDHLGAYAACAVAASVAVSTSVGVAGADRPSTPTWNGTCHITGKLLFMPNIKGNPAPISYDFISGSPGPENTNPNGPADPNGTTCTGTLNGQSVTIPVGAASATLSGTGYLGCSVSSNEQPVDSKNEPGSGYIQLTYEGKTYRFQFDSVTLNSVAAEIVYTTSQSSSGASATGIASVVQYAPLSTPIDCNTGNGLSSAGFTADSNQPNKPFLGTCVSGCSSSGSTSGGHGTSIGTTAPNHHHHHRRRDQSAYGRCVKKAKKTNNKHKRKAALSRCKQTKKKEH